MLKFPTPSGYGGLTVVEKEDGLRQKKKMYTCICEREKQAMEGFWGRWGRAGREWRWRVMYTDEKGGRFKERR